MNEQVQRRSSHKPHKRKFPKQKTSKAKQSAIDEQRANAVTLFLSLPIIKNQLPLHHSCTYKIVDRVRTETGVSGVFVRKLIAKHRKREQYHKTVLARKQRFDVDGQFMCDVSDEDLAYHKRQIDKIIRNRNYVNAKKAKRSSNGRKYG